MAVSSCNHPHRLLFQLQRFGDSVAASTGAAVLFPSGGGLISSFPPPPPPSLACGACWSAQDLSVEGDEGCPCQLWILWRLRLSALSCVRRLLRVWEVTLLSAWCPLSFAPRVCLDIVNRCQLSEASAASSETAPVHSGPLRPLVLGSWSHADGRRASSRPCSPGTDTAGPHVGLFHHFVECH